MMKASDFLPDNSTLWEETMADVMAVGLLITDNINDIRGAKLLNPPPSLLPFLIYEYGLGELTPYVPNLYDLIDEGIDWQRLRGTPRAVEMGLGWIGYTAQIEDANSHHRFWNMMQLHLNRVRGSFSDLARIEGIAELSTPERTRFWRGFHGYDVRPLAWGMKAWSGSTWGEYSGVRVRPDGPLWSFGRYYEFDTSISRQDLESIDAWVEPDWTQYTGDLGWEDYTWVSTEANWQTVPSAAHAQSMASIIHPRSAWVAFIDGAGQVIGYRRARAKWYAAPSIDGPYSVDGDVFTPTAEIQAGIYIEAMTAFGEGNGQTAKQVALSFGGGPASGIKPGTQWIIPAQAVGMGPLVARQDVDIAMGESIRECVKFMLRLDGVYELPHAMVTLDTSNGVEIDFFDDSYAERWGE